MAPTIAPQQTRSRALAVVLAVAWALLGGGGLAIIAFWTFIITMSVRWTTATHVLMWGVLPAFALLGGVPAAVAFARGRGVWRVCLLLLASLLAVPLLLLAVLLSTERVGGS